jgi:hypothetical protein
MNFFYFFLLFLSANNLYASTRSIASVMTEMGLHAQGGKTTYDLEGYNLAELVVSYAVQSGEVTDETTFIFDYKDVESADEVVYGTTDAKTFSQILFSAIHFMDNDALANEMLYSVDKRQRIDELLKELQSLQPIYSWNPVGDNVCGSSLTTPVVIDPQTKKAYELNFYKIEGC